jgi:hypothetical protein
LAAHRHRQPDLGHHQGSINGAKKTINGAIFGPFWAFLAFFEAQLENKFALLAVKNQHQAK